MAKLQIVGDMCLTRDEIARDWEIVDAEPDAVFVAYDREPNNWLPPSVKVVGTNMSRPAWTTTVTTVTTRDIPREILNSITPTAEHAIGLMMALHRNLIPALREPLADRSKFLAPRMLSRMTAGIIGMGRIGTMLWHRLKPMMGNVHWYDPIVAEANVTKLPGLLPLNSIVSDSYILFLCCPSSPFGHPMGLAEFGQMPHDALIINIAQPDLLNWSEVLDALHDRILRGVASDVFPAWVAKSDFGLGDALLLTPHIAGSTLDARRITEQAVLDVMRRRL